MRRRDREQREREAVELALEHAQLRARLLVTVERTDQLGDDLLAEVRRWAEERGDDAT